jgi:hypothetical protein
MLNKSKSIFITLCTFVLGLCFNLNLALANTIINPAESGEFYCPICKYAQGKVEYTTNTVEHLSWRGATYTGDCGTYSNSNDTKRWMLKGAAIYNDTTNDKIYGYDNGNWKYNCEIPSWAYTINPNKARPADASAHFWWLFEKNDGTTWPLYLRLDF